MFDKLLKKAMDYLGDETVDKIVKEKIKEERPNISEEELEKTYNEVKEKLHEQSK